MERERRHRLARSGGERGSLLQGLLGYQGAEKGLYALGQADKFENLHEMDTSLRKHSLPKRKQEGEENLNALKRGGAGRGPGQAS